MFELVTGTLKGFDQLMNLVLDDVKETTRGEYYWELLAWWIVANLCRRRRGQHQHEESWLASSKRNTSCSHQPSGWQRGDCQPIRSGR